MAKRKCKDWLASYLAFAEGQESPDLFHVWCGISLLAATLERNVSLDLGYYTIYPNLYIVIVGPSATSRKSTAIKMVTRLGLDALTEEGLNVMAQKLTPEALIHIFHMAAEERDVSCGYAVNDELSTMLGESLKSSALLKMLTTLYDCPPFFIYYTIARGKEVCRDTCLNILGGTTPEWLQDSLPSHVIGGGFTSRLLFIFAPPSGRREPFPSLTPEQKALRMDLTYDLRLIRELKGAYEFDVAARAYYAEWYIEVFKPDREDATLRGYYGRKHDTLLKVAMVLAASRRDELLVGEQEVIDALKMTKELERWLPAVLQSIQTTPVGRELARLRAIIERLGEVSHSRLLQMVSYFADAKKVRELVDTLVQSGVVLREKRGVALWYVTKTSQ